MLSNTQKRILKLLAINSWFSNKDIAKSIHVSEDVVSYQVQKLIKEDYAIFVNNFHMKMLGFDHHHYLIRFKDIEKLPLDKLIEIPQVFFANTSSGAYDLQLIICHRDDQEFMRLKDSIDSLLAGKIAESLILKFYVSYKFTNMIPAIDIPVAIPKNAKNPIYRLNSEDWHCSETILHEQPHFTDGEKKTLKALLANPRAPYSEIGRLTQQSYETVRQQIIKFVQQGYIGNFGIFTKFEKFGYFTNYLLLNIENLDDAAFKRYVHSNNRIFYASKFIGKYNIILYFVSTKPSEFHDEIKKLRKLFPNKIVSSEMLSFDSILKSIQFPMVLLD